MKKLMIMLMFLISIVSVLALYSGESYTIYNEGCEYLEIRVVSDSEIEEGEFTLSENCQKVDDFFNCNCETPTVFTTKTNAVNTYEITIDIWKMIETTPTAGSSGGGGHHGSGSNCVYSCKSWGICAGGKQTRTCTPNIYCDENDQNKALIERTCSSTTEENIPRESEGIETTPIEIEQGKPIKETVNQGKITGEAIKEVESNGNGWLSIIKAWLIHIFTMIFG